VAASATMSCSVTSEPIINQPLEAHMTWVVIVTHALIVAFGGPGGHSYCTEYASQITQLYQLPGVCVLQQDV
jgi:hypothetical protein